MAERSVTWGGGEAMVTAAADPSDLKATNKVNVALITEIPKCRL